MDEEERERTTRMQTMMIEMDEEESLEESIEQFEEKLEYMNLPEEKKQKIKELCTEIKKEEKEETRDFLLKLLQKKDIKLINKLVNYNNLEELSKYVKLEDAYYKILKKNKFHEHEYLDYLRMNALLERDLKDKRILFPKNLMEEHDKLVKLIKLVEDEQNDKLIKLRLKKLNKNIFQNEKYIVFPAPSIESLQKEANSQKNCLLLYCKKYALGECDIFFLRKRKNIDESLVTIEIRNSKIIQARSKYNEPINKEQEKFLNTWAKKVLLKEAVKNA